MEGSVGAAGAQPSAAEGTPGAAFNSPGLPEHSGQGPAAGGDANARYLSDVPQELRPMVEAVLKAKDADVTRGFEDHNQFRQKWEPYSKVEGLDGADPQEIQALLAFRDTLTNPDEFSQWLSRAVASTGWADEETWAAIGQQNGWIDGVPTGGNEPGGEGEMPPWAQQLLQENQQLRQEVHGRFEEQDTQQEQGQLREGFETRMNQLVTEHAQFLPPEGDEERDTVLTDVIHRAMGMVAMTPDGQEPPEDPIGDAFKSYLRVKGGAEGDALEARLQRQQGGATLTGGRADTSAPQLSWNGNGQDPKEAALARMRGA